MASMGHEGGFARSLQGPLAVHFITFGKNNAHLAWRARSNRSGGVLPTARFRVDAQKCMEWQDGLHGA